MTKNDDKEYDAYTLGVRHTILPQIQYVHKNNKYIANILTLSFPPSDSELDWICRYIQDQLQTSDLSFYLYKNFITFQYNEDIQSNMPNWFSMQVYNQLSTKNKWYIKLGEINRAYLNFLDNKAHIIDDSEHEDDAIHHYIDAVHLYFDALKPYIHAKIIQTSQSKYPELNEILLENISLREVDAFKNPLRIDLTVGSQWSNEMKPFNGTRILI